MKIKQTYVAYDATEFEHEDLCVSYENRHLDIIESILRKVAFLDKNKNETHIDEPLSIDELEETVSAIENAYNDCDDVDIYEELTYDEDEWLMSESGICIPLKPGRYHYDHDFNEWVKEEE